MSARPEHREPNRGVDAHPFAPAVAPLAAPHAEPAVIVRNLAQTDHARWDAFVEASPGATFFHLSGWGEAVESTLGHRLHYLYAEAGGIIEGVLPLGHVRTRLFGNALVSAPFSVYGGIVATTDRARAALRKAAESLAESLGVDYLELRNRDADDDGPPQKDLYVTFRKPLAPDPEENLKAIPRKQRAMVRKGIAAGLSGEIDPGVDRFYAQYSTSLRNLGTPVLPRRWYAALARIFGERCEVLTIVHQGQPVCSVMSFYFRDEVLPYYGGGGEGARALKANDFMYYELMRRACERGVKLFDYGRSKQGAGSYSFKKNWGFEPEPLHYRYHLVRAKAVPDLSPVNPRYQRAVRIWQRLPLPVTRLVGPLVARGLG